MLTNCTFDGQIYNVERVMEECLAIKPDLIFLWDEAWFGYARWSPFYRRRTAMGAAELLERKFKDPAYRAAYQEQAKKLGPDLNQEEEVLLETGCWPIQTRYICAFTRQTQRTSPCRRYARVP